MDEACCVHVLQLFLWSATWMAIFTRLIIYVCFFVCPGHSQLCNICLFIIQHVVRVVLQSWNNKYLWWTVKLLLFTISFLIFLLQILTIIIHLHVGDELFSDTYKMTVVDDIFYEVEGKVCCNSFIKTVITILVTNLWVYWSLWSIYIQYFRCVRAIPTYCVYRLYDKGYGSWIRVYP